MFACHAGLTNPEIKYMQQTFFVILIFTVLTLVYKTVHYLRHFSKKKLYCWLYFGRNEVMLSSTASRRAAKERQNSMSLVAAIGLILSSAMYFLMY
jgi:hypothetical protein